MAAGSAAGNSGCRVGGIPIPTEAAMTTTPSPQDKAGTSTRARPVQTGALPGNQPGQGVNTSSSAPGQQAMDAAVGQGVEYGEKHRPSDPAGKA